MSELAWLAGGLLVGLLNALAMSVAVQRLDPSAPARGVQGLVWGAALRWLCLGLLLAVALRQGGLAGLLAFGGLWLARWAAVAWWQGQRGEQAGWPLWKR